MKKPNISLQGVKNSLGPGLIMAAAALGGAHHVHSTRAGADFGFALVGAVILANVVKYPALGFVSRYALATGQNMIQGYASLYPVAFWIFTIFTISTMFAIHAAVTMVTASLATNLTGIELPLLAWSAIILVLSNVYLARNTYAMLDRAIKLLMILLALSTITAVTLTLLNFTYTPPAEVISTEIWTVSGVAFIIALMGWMPIPIDAAAWQSIWTLERIKQTGYKPKLGEVQFDFNLGYIGTAIIALCFLTLGAFLMFGSGQEYATSAAAFSNQLIELYTTAMGDWAYFIIAICAFTRMFSTTLTVTDSYPRVINHIIHTRKGTDVRTEPSSKMYAYLLLGISAGYRK